MSATPWATAIGKRLSTLRREPGLSQDDLARRLVEYGVPWTRATVASVEIGRREITLREAHALALAFDLVVEELEPERGSVALSETVAVSADKLRVQLADVPLTLPEKKRSPSGSATARRQDEETAEILRLLPEAKNDRLAIMYIRTDARVEATLAIARRTGSTPIQVASAAYKLWRMGVSQRRDRLVQHRAPANASAESVRRIRGHVTRALTQELVPEIATMKTRAKTRRKK